ncbi:MAG: hypothetical protein LBI03_06125 [Clostridiales bacterium]|nr:hypothetical protein [Clostridiales bacterium]
MKKKVLFLTVLIVAVLAMQISVFAATPAVTAKAGKATIDGVINADEYGPAVTTDSSNAQSWTNAAPADCPTTSFYFAWDVSGLSVGVKTVLGALTADKVTTQINLATADADGSKQAIFFTFTTDATGVSKVSRQNYSVGDVTSANTVSKVVDGTYVFETFIPADQLGGKGADPKTNLDNMMITLAAGTTAKVGTYVLTKTADVTNAYTNVSGVGKTAADSTCWNISNMGVLSFAASDGTVPTPPPTTPTPPPTSPTPVTGDPSFILAAVGVITSGVLRRKFR